MPDTVIDWSTIAPFASESDWECAFGESDYTTSCRPGPFGRADVAEVLAAFAYSGERLPSVKWSDPLTPGGCSTERYYGQIRMYGAFRLRDGRFGYIEAGADTTGWGCQDDNTFAVSDTLDGLVRLMGDEGRSVLRMTTKEG